MFFVSACLVGMKCRYDGGTKRDLPFLKSIQGHRIIFGCPESLGGLPTPRSPSHITSGSGEDVLNGNAAVINENGEDVTACFLKGAETTFEMIYRWCITKAFLKAKSPSCGITAIIRNGETVAGTGVTAALLKHHDIELIEI